MVTPLLRLKACLHPLGDTRGISAQTAPKSNHEVAGMECSFSYWQTSPMHISPRQNMTNSEKPSDLDSQIVDLVRQC